MQLSEIHYYLQDIHSGGRRCLQDIHSGSRRLCGCRSAYLGYAMVTLDEFSRLVAGIYAAAAAPQLWERGIRDIQRTLGGTGASLLLGDGAVWSFQDSTIPVAALESYAQYYQPLDYVLAAVEKGPIGAVRTGPQVIVPNRNGQFYTGWMRPNDLEDGLFVRLTGGPKPTCFLVTSPKPDFDTPERVKVLGALVAHLQQALRTQTKLAALAHDSGALTEALDVVGHGVVIVGSEGLVLNLNSAAEAVLRAEDGLQQRSGRIAAGPHAHKELHHALHHALAGGGSTIRHGHTLACPRPSGSRPYVIHVLPLHRTAQDDKSRDPAALVLIVDREQEHEPAAALLHRLHGLTPTEAQVALRISRGASPKQIAAELSVSYQTVRTHLQHIFDKTDTHRQGELIRLLLALHAW
jgi:DNA-binding CsgD family transcriptional regulator